MTNSRRDEEYYTLQVSSLIKTNLNGTITAINTEKNDGISLSAVDSSAYYYLTFGKDQPVYDPVVIFGVEPEEGETRAGESSEQLSMTIELVVSDKLLANSETLFKILARYRRAIKETIRDHWGKLPVCALTDLPNIAFTSKSGGIFYSVGVGVRFKFVN